MRDLEFAHRCATGNKALWDKFVDRYSRLIYKYIRSVLTSKGFVITQDNLSDIFQGIFLSLIKDNFNKLRSFKAKNGSSLASWLRQVTINATLDYSRKLMPMKSIEQENEDDLSLKDILPDSALLARDKISHEEKITKLRDCIKKMVRKDKYFLELHLNRGLKIDQLKRHLKMSRAAIDMRKSRIIDKLRDCFKTKDFKLDF
ncbi:MAG: sigma-70 family RNA polymerase sigma factor [Candidatus Omnitrophota bacterium]